MIPHRLSRALSLSIEARAGTICATPLELQFSLFPFFFFLGVMQFSSLRAVALAFLVEIPKVDTEGSRYKELEVDNQVINQ